MPADTWPQMKATASQQSSRDPKEGSSLLQGGDHTRPGLASGSCLHNVSRGFKRRFGKCHKKKITL